MNALVYQNNTHTHFYKNEHCLNDPHLHQPRESVYIFFAVKRLQSWGVEMVEYEGKARASVSRVSVIVTSGKRRWMK